MNSQAMTAVAGSGTPVADRLRETQGLDLGDRHRLNDHLLKRRNPI